MFLNSKKIPNILHKKLIFSIINILFFKYFLSSIHEFKIRQIIEQEYERLLQEERGYPQGTTKILEIERVNILDKLYKTKDELLNDLVKFPVSSHVRSVKIQNKKSTIEGKLEQIDYAIRIFERNKVFVKNSSRN